MAASNHISEPETREPQEHGEVLDGRDRRAHVGDPLPVRMKATDMCVLLGFSVSGFYDAVKAGKFDSMEILPKVGARAWSGVRVQQWLDGQMVSRSFGRKQR